MDKNLYITSYYKFFIPAGWYRSLLDILDLFTHLFDQYLELYRVAGCGAGN
jgi:hypothetical protein